MKDDYDDEIKNTKEYSKKIGVPFVDLDSFEIDIAVASLIPTDTAKKYRVLPLKREEHILVLAMANPLNVFVIDDVKMMTGLDISPVMAMESQLDYYLENISCNADGLIVCREEARRVKELAKKLGTPFYYLYFELFDLDAVAMIPAETARHFKTIPITKIGNKLYIVMADCRDAIAISALEKITGCKIEYAQTMPSDIENFLDILYKKEKSSGDE